MSLHPGEFAAFVWQMKPPLGSTGLPAEAERSQVGPVAQVVRAYA